MGYCNCSQELLQLGKPQHRFKQVKEKFEMRSTVESIDRWSDTNYQKYFIFTRFQSFWAVLCLIFTRIHQTFLIRLYQITIFLISFISKHTYRPLAVEQQFNKSMEPSIEEIEKLNAQGKKKVKPDPAWIAKKKQPSNPLTVSISDFTKTNRFHSHKFLQTYLRYLLTQTVTNPMWLLIRRQSMVEQIVYIDLQIECGLFEEMLNNKQLPFLSSIINENNKGYFKSQNRMRREDLWQKLLCYECEDKMEDLSSKTCIEEMSTQIDQQLYDKYAKFILTPEELKTHQYPDKKEEEYESYYQLTRIDQNQAEIKNKILVVDCEMVSSVKGFELARATIINFEGEIIFDEFFKPDIEIINYNTPYSGITAQILDPVTNTLENKLYPFLESIMCNDTILIGHSLENDLKAMRMIYNKVIDSSVLFMRKNRSKFKLKSLSEKILKRQIQVGEHNSIEDCEATLHLVRAKIENDDKIRDKQYHLLKDISALGRNVAIVDYAIDEKMKEFTNCRFDKTEQYESSTKMFDSCRPYLKVGEKNPNLTMTRIEKPQKEDWEQFYLSFDSAFHSFHSSLPKMTLIFLNCQYNPTIQLTPTSPLKSTRSPCFILAV